MIPCVDGPENDLKSYEDNIPDIIPGTPYTHLLKDNQIIRNNVSDSIAHWFYANIFIRFLCASKLAPYSIFLR